MGDNKSYKIIAIVALMIGVVGVTLGYAALQKNLTVSPAAEVNPTGLSFNVEFSSSDQNVVTGQTVAPTLSDDNVLGFSATTGTITNGANPTISGIVATFTAAQQYVTYTFYAHNDSSYTAHLKSITFDGTQTCTAGTNTTQSMATAACSDITMKVSVGGTDYTSSDSSISGVSINANGYQTIVLRIDYASSGTATLVDGDFTVALPQIVFNYATA